MYTRFTDRLREVMQFANQEAQRLNHEYIGTEHLLLALVNVGGGAAVEILKNLGVEPHTVTSEVAMYIKKGLPPPITGSLPPTPRAKMVVEYAMEESRNLGCEYVGTEHLLLGLLREDYGFASVLLMNLGVRLDQVRAEIQANLGLHDDEERQPSL